MKILYLRPEHGRPFFYADPSQIADDADQADGARGWAAAKWAEIEARWKTSPTAAARFSRKVWDWLQTSVRPDEPLLAKLGSAESITLHHPSATSEKKTRSAWRRYLAARASTHLLWVIVDAVLAVLTGLVLWILPGPNVIFFWFAYRAYSHYGIVRSLHHARWHPPPTTAESDPALDEPVARDSHGVPRHLAVEDHAALRHYVERRRHWDDTEADPEVDVDAETEAEAGADPTSQRTPGAKPQ
ncbi:hypothetical protein [Paludisphaera rhizosphaerae]|uniref:hypothetical protein n=1 Tax=Paludisphaera rhizosphaerae TaxID=2711216 RepID=UPI0013ECF972|nr:hypothetical protein [Paludisphaera rhizosphaerae]